MHLKSLNKGSFSRKKPFRKKLFRYKFAATTRIWTSPSEQKHAVYLNSQQALIFTTGTQQPNSTRKQ